MVMVNIWYKIGYKVKIPAIFINENYGDKLKKLAE